MQEVTKLSEDSSSEEEKTGDGEAKNVVEFVHFGDIRSKTSMVQLQKGDFKPIKEYSREKFLDTSSEERRNYHQKGSSLVHQSHLDSVSTLYSTRRLQSSENKVIYPADPALNDKIYLWYGDITRLKVDAIVNSVKWALKSPRKLQISRSGVSGAIFKVAGQKQMVEEIAHIPETESCLVTSGYNLPAKYVLHGNVPNYMDEESALKKIYLDCLQKIKDLKIRTVAFPCIATGSQEFPRREAAQIALSTVSEWLSDKSNADQISAIIFCIYRDTLNWEVYASLLPHFFPPDENNKNKDLPIPVEILRMDDEFLKTYKEALKYGTEKVYNIRVMVVGHYGVGKTTLVQRLLGKEVDITEITSTEGIDVHVHCFDVSLKSKEWVLQEKDAEKFIRLQRLIKLLNAKLQKVKVSDQNEQVKVTDQRERTPGVDAIVGVDATGKQTESRPLHEELFKETHQKPDMDHTHHSDECSDKISVSDPNAHGTMTKNDPAMEILELLVENADKLERVKEVSAGLSMWDFAGQYIFYTTHQTFLTRRAVYLLVIDLSQQIKDLVKDDECFFDREGIKPCKVHDLAEIWLNSIHSCAPSPQAGIPPVILVGTHMDKIPQESRQEVCESVFNQLRYELQDKPTRFHLTDEDFAIDNTFLDPRLEDLKKKIVQLASQQPYWGEEVPARWLPLEQVLMKLKASGIKVIPYSLVECLNKAGAVQIETREELDLFLRFLHEMGTILFFNTDVLKEKIVLDPQWLIDALKSLITAEMFILKKPAIIDKWCEFKKKGKLTQELIDAIWTKDKNPDLHDNKEHILLLMEQLNIVAKTRSFSDDGEEVKIENYFLVPCMLRQTMPKEVICPEPNPQMESTSVLCYVFKEKFLPPPIFHRILAACLACWPIAKRNSENMIFSGCSVFDLDPSHRLTLHFKEYVIFARIARMGIKDRTPNAKVCIKIREFITEKLSEIFGYLCQELDFELCIQCPRLSGDNLDGMVPVSILQENAELACHCHEDSHVITSNDLLRFWFKDGVCSGGDTVDGSISCLPLYLLDHVPSEKHLSRLSLKIGKEFLQLGLELEVPWARIEQIQVESPHIPTQCFRILQAWVQRNANQATFRYLEKAFRSVGIDASILNEVL
ncbi:hypothetical protein CHS0354_008835 [Potamilus streckersoni]|uniref:non-specific serine/threonine protein kinase n=1 Tax=Potamilus streckersoni TaxID=2493646 RepID=A0AAE0SNR3_9BIVA|nr:hypothetical protein CHS0354_008835 [Potamilus streckersoni]